MRAKSLGRRVREKTQTGVYCTKVLNEVCVMAFKEITFVIFLSLALTMASMVPPSPRMRDVNKYRGLCSIPLPLTPTLVCDGSSWVSRQVSRMQQTQNLTESFDCSEIQPSQFGSTLPEPPAQQLQQQELIAGPRIEV